MVAAIDAVPMLRPRGQDSERGGRQRKKGPRFRGMAGTGELGGQRLRYYEAQELLMSEYLCSVVLMSPAARCTSRNGVPRAVARLVWDHLDNEGYRFQQALPLDRRSPEER